MVPLFDDERESMCIRLNLEITRIPRCIEVSRANSEGGTQNEESVFLA